MATTAVRTSQLHGTTFRAAPTDTARTLLIGILLAIVAGRAIVLCAGLARRRPGLHADAAGRAGIAGQL